MKKQLLKLIDTSGNNETLAVRTDSKGNNSILQKSSKKQQKAVVKKRSKSVNQVNK